MDLQAQIQSYVKVPSGFDYNSHVLEGTKDVMRQIKKSSPDELSLFTQVVPIGAEGADLDMNSIYHVERYGRSARLIKPADKNRVQDSGSIYYATSEFPVYYVEDKRIYVAPKPTAGLWGSIVPTFAKSAIDGYETSVEVTFKIGSDLINHNLTNFDHISLLYKDTNSILETDYFGGDWAVSVKDVHTILLKDLTFADDHPVWEGIAAQSSNYNIDKVIATGHMTKHPKVTTDGTTTTITPFPDHYLNSVALYASIQACKEALSGFSDSYISTALQLTSPNSPNFTDIDVVDFSSLIEYPGFVKPSFVFNTMENVNALVLPTPPEAPENPVFNYSSSPITNILGSTVSFDDMTSLDAKAPVYESPSLVTSEPPDISFDVPTFPDSDNGGVSIPIIPQSLQDLEFSVSAQVPLPPDNVPNLIDFDISTNAPTYTAPARPIAGVVTFNGTVPNIDDYGSGIGFEASDDMATFLDDEDPEMVSAAVQVEQMKISAVQADVQQYSSEVQKYGADLNKFQQEIGLYQADLQNSLNSFNEEQVKYQAELQVALADAEMKSKDDAENIQKFSAEVQAYQTEVNAEVQIFQAQLQKDLQLIQTETQLWTAFVDKEIKLFQGNIQHLSAKVQLFQTTRTTELQEYATAVQDAVNVFNKEQVVFQEDVQRKTTEFQSKVQKGIQDAQISLDKQKTNLNKDLQLQMQESLQSLQADIQEYQSKIALYQGELSSYQAEVNASIQSWINSEWNVKFLKYQTDLNAYLQEYQAEISSETASSGAGAKEYEVKLGKIIQEFQLNLSKITEMNQRELGRYNAEVQVLATELNKATILIQEDASHYQWYLQKYQLLKAEYMESLGFSAQPQQAAA